MNARAGVIIGDHIIDLLTDTLVVSPVAGGNCRLYQDEALVELYKRFKTQEKITRLYGALLKEMSRNQLRVTAANEYRRWLGSLCKKASETLGETISIEEANAIMWPLYLDLVNEMGGEVNTSVSRRNRGRRG